VCSYFYVDTVVSVVGNLFSVICLVNAKRSKVFEHEVLRIFGNGIKYMKKDIIRSFMVYTIHLLMF
jgi:hypothetical protein